MKHSFMSSVQWLCMLVFISMSSIAHGMTSNDSFHNGIKFFKQKRYDLALEAFKGAEEQGFSGADLSYNLGATYYQLKRYEKAINAFSQIVADAKWGRLALYNLGLIEERRGHDRRAFDHYLQSYQQAVTEKEKMLAGLKVKQLRDRLQTHSNRRWYGTVQAGLGWDDNVYLVEDEVGAVIQPESDNFLELLASLSGYVDGNWEQGTRLDIGLYQRNYRELDAFDFTALSVGVARELQKGDWTFEGGLRGEFSEVEGSRFLNVSSIRLRAGSSIGALRYKMGVEYQKVSAASDFDYLAGDSWSTRVQFDWPLKESDLRLSLGHEVNDRDDRVLVDEFQSYSPSRNQLLLRYSKMLNENWKLNASIQLRDSTHSDENVQQNPDGSVIQAKREDSRKVLRIRFERYLPVTSEPNGWTAFMTLRYTDNESNFDRYRYSSSQLTLGVEKLF